MARRMVALGLALIGALAYPLATRVVAVSPPPPPGFKQFASARDHYQLLYPDSWTLSSRGGTQYFNGPRVAGFRTNVNVTIITGASGVTSANLRPLVAQAYRREGATIEQTTATRIAGHSGWWIAGRLTRKISGRIVHDRFATATFVWRHTVWEITLSTAPTAYAGTLGTFRTILGSFALT